MAKNIFIIILMRLLALLLYICRLIARVLTCKWLKRTQRIGELPTYVTNKQRYSESEGIPVPSSAAEWSTWSSDNAQNIIISDRIKEYRHKKQEELQAARAAMKDKSGHYPNVDATMAAGNATADSKELDLFFELQPNVKAPKKLLLRSNQKLAQDSQAKRDLFAVQYDNCNAHNAANAFLLNEAAQSGQLGELHELVDDDDDGGMVNSSRDGGNWNGRERLTSWLDEEDNIDVDQLNAIERDQRRRERMERNRQRQAEHAQQAEERKKQQQKMGTAQAKGNAEAAGGGGRTKQTERQQQQQHRIIHF